METTLESHEAVTRDSLADIISNRWDSWKNQRNGWERERSEIRDYIFATDTSNTSSITTPWKNKTHLPKICHIRDNLIDKFIFVNIYFINCLIKPDNIALCVVN